MFKPHFGLDVPVQIDTLIIPGGCGLREPKTNARVSAASVKHQTVNPIAANAPVPSICSNKVC